jgi:hypothetical protein
MDHVAEADARWAEQANMIEKMEIIEREEEEEEESLFKADAVRRTQAQTSWVSRFNVPCTELNVASWFSM